MFCPFYGGECNEFCKLSDSTECAINRIAYALVDLAEELEKKGVALNEQQEEGERRRA